MNITQRETGFVKAYAIIFVLIPHVITTYLSEKIRIETYALSVMGIGAVFLFLFVSGYGLYMSFEKNGLKGYWNKKVRKVFFPYWVITIAYFFLFVSAVGPANLLLNLACLDFSRTIDGTMWYLTFYLIWIAAFFLVFSADVPTWFRLVLLFLLGWFILEQKDTGLFVKCDWQFRRNAFAFPLGVLAAYLSKAGLRNLKINPWIRILLMLAAVAGFVLLYRPRIDTGIRYMLLGLTALVALHELFALAQKNGGFAFVERIGEGAYILYLLESKFFVLVARVAPASWPTWPRVTLYVILCILTIWAVNGFNRRKQTT